MNNNENTNNIENLETTEPTKAPKKSKKVLIISIIAAALAVIVVATTLILLGIFKGEEPEPYIPAKIVENGVANYTIVYPDACSDALFRQLTALNNAIETTTGLRLEMVKASQATDPDQRYIILGSTAFDETIAAIDTLANNEDAFTITKTDKHIVFTGHFDSATALSVEYFINNLLYPNYDATTNTLTLKEYTYEGTVALPASFNAKNISLYTIVYSATGGNGTSNKDVAEKIQKRIADTTGKTLEIKKDTGVAESAYEILIGQTNRYLSKKCYADGTRLMEYEFVVDKGQLQIVCGGLYSARMGGYELANVVSDKSISLAAGSHEHNDLAPKSVAHTKGTDVRIMTANILSYTQVTNDGKTDKFPPSEERAEIFAKILVDYTPDFVGLQEMDAGYHSAMTGLLKVVKETYGLEYSIILAKYNGKINHSPIIYRSDKFKVDEQKFTTVSYAQNGGKDGYGSGISSAKFTSLEDPTVEIALLSAHWYWGDTSQSEQREDATVMANIVNELQAKYPNAKIFSTGDFNSHRWSRTYLNAFLRDTNGAIASDIAKNNGVLKDSFKHMNQYIDHIIGTKGTFNVLLHQGTDNGSKTLTDHQPVFADIKFTK